MAVAKFGDTAATLVMLESGAGLEINPVANQVLAAFGPFGLWLKALLAIVLVVGALELWGRYVGMSWLPIVGYIVATLIFASAAIHNVSIWLTGIELIPVTGVLA